MISHGGTPLKSVLRTITPSSSNNSPSKLALRLDTMKKTIGSLRIRPSPSMAFKKKISFKDDIHAEDFDSNPDVFKKNDLPNLLKTFSI